MLIKFIRLIVKIINFLSPQYNLKVNVSSEEVKEKLKQLKYQHYKKMLHKYLSKYPENCKYNKVVTLPNKHQLNICTFNLEDIVNVDLCYKVEHSKDCNAFCPIYTKEKLKEKLIAELKDPQKRATHYKDIHTLYWLFPELELQDFPKKRKSIIKKIQNIFKR